MKGLTSINTKHKRNNLFTEADINKQCMVYVQKLI